jgi:hypothetical protein
VQGIGADSANPELKAIVLEASRALSLLDATRLEELALSCSVLIRDRCSHQTDDERSRSELARQAREAARDLAVFGRVLDATRANLNVMHRLREIRMGLLEYRVDRGDAAGESKSAEDRHGND